MSKYEKKSGSKRGRPRKEFDKRTFENLCAIQSTIIEMCAFFECDTKTLENWCKREYGKTFHEVFREKRCKGFISLRRAQFQKAIEEKNTAMLIFLGKNWLGQSDRQEVKLDSPLQVSSGYDLSNLSEQELLNLREILLKAKQNGQTTDNSGD